MSEESDPRERGEPTDAQTPPPQQLFPQYLDGFVRFTQLYFDRALEVTLDDPETHSTAGILAATANAAANETARELRRIFDAADTATRASANRQITLSGGMPLLGAALGTVGTIGVPAKGALAWIGIIIVLIKKLLGILFKNMPQWLHDLLEFIDELWEILQSLLGGRLQSQIAFEMRARYLTSLRLIQALQTPVEPSPGAATASEAA